MCLEKTNFGKNISTAVEVLTETYKNLQNFFSELDRIAEEEGFISLTPRFLRWKSDSDPSGWLVTDMIKLYQSENEPDLPNLPEMKSAPIYGVEVDLASEDHPAISVIQYTFDFSEWSRLPSVSDHWIFYYPFRDDSLFDIDEENGVWTSTPFEKAKKRYWGIEKAVAIDIPLVEINSPEMVRSEIFQKFDKLSK